MARVGLPASDVAAATAEPAQGAKAMALVLFHRAAQLPIDPRTQPIEPRPWRDCEGARFRPERDLAREEVKLKRRAGRGGSRLHALATTPEHSVERPSIVG